MNTDYKQLAYEAIENNGLFPYQKECMYVYVSERPSMIYRNMLDETDYKDVIAKIESIKKAAGV